MDPSSRVEVRDAQRSDADAICDAHVSAWRLAYRGLFPDEYLDSDEFDAARRQRWRAWTWGTGSSRLFVSVVDTAVVGFAHCGRERGEDGLDRGEVYAFYLHPSAWGTGAATMMMESCADELRHRGFGDAVLWVLRDNPRARAFYEKAGWTSTAEASMFTPTGESFSVAEVQYSRTLR